MVAKMNNPIRIIGALSGTSMDGVSLGLYEFDAQNKPTTLAHMTEPLPDNYREDLLAIIKSGECSFDQYGQTDRWVGELFAAAILKFLAANNIDKSTITAIGSHGQTIWHAPQAERPFTLQIGDPNIIAVKTGIPTVADFRRADMAAGGQGAPLAPAFHLTVFGNANEPRCIVNIGGFSNVSILENNQYRGFDTGPGNCLMDHWVKEYFALDYDKDGALAASGTCNETLLNCMLADPYFARSAPKSTGREYFNPEWLRLKLVASGQPNLPPVTVLATLLELTAFSIAQEIKRYASPTTKVFICGGGAHNVELCKRISTHLEQNVESTATVGIHPDCVESALFAWLAKLRLDNIPANLSAITGAQKPVVLGGIYGGLT